MTPPLSRRDALTAGALGACVALAPREAPAAEPAPGGPTKPGLLKQGGTVLFQGDSITDAGRDRKANDANSHAALGKGYAFLAAAELLIGRPDLELKLHNRGVSGNKVHQLNERWKADCTDLKPDLVSILIGVNDIWHWINGNYSGTIETYRQDYRALLERTRQELPDAKVVVCEPFVLKTGAVNDKWFPKFDEFRAAAKELAGELADAFVPFQAMFDAAAGVAHPSYWLRDGVHPAPAGDALMAHAWLKAVGA